jgi:hypothetical protein
MSKKILIFVALVVVLSSCASVNKAVSLNRPYDTVTPITIPLPPPTYKPAKIKIKMLYETAERDYTIYGEVKVTQMGDRLLWDMNVNGGTGSHRISVRMLSDFRGGSIQSEEPLWSGTQDKADQKEFANFIKSFSTLLSDKEIVTTDVFSENSQGPTKDGDVIIKAGMRKYLDGWASYKGKRVLATKDTGEFLSVNSSNAEREFYGITGFSLFDPMTNHLIYSEQIAFFKSPIMKFTYSADILSE